MTSDTSANHHPFVQFIYLVLLVLAGLIVASVIGVFILMGAGGISSGQVPVLDSSNIEAMKWAQLVYTLGGFLLPAWFFASVIMRNTDAYLPVHDAGKPVLILLVILLMVVSMPMMEWLITINRNMILPDSLAGLERWMQEMEDENSQLTKRMLEMPDTASFIFNLVVIAFIPALAEEFLFRGCVQGIFKQWFGNGHAAVWASAALFSFIHFQFYGFLPRMALGVLFGYLVLLSGSLWPAVLAHLLNNGFAVVATYLYQHQYISSDMDEKAVFPVFSYLMSFGLTLGVLFLYRKKAQSKIPELS